MRYFSISSSPSAEVSLARYDADRHPEFRHIDSREASYSVIFENRSDKSIIALRYRWTANTTDGRAITVHGGTDIYKAGGDAVVEAGRRILLTSDGMILYELQGEPCLVSGGRSTRKPSFYDTTEVSFAVDLIVFGDGEIAGPDPDNYVIDLESRKLAAEFLAKQVRMAESENRDVMPILTALAEMPDGTKSSANFLQLCASALRNAMHRDGIVRSLENMPPLPKLYRRSQP